MKAYTGMVDSIFNYLFSACWIGVMVGRMKATGVEHLF